jgi:predicted transposase/invertase (TIGR01784 family)
MWNERGWSPEEKRDILEAIEYLIHLTDEDYKRQMVKHVENLKMSEEDRKMYQSIFEQVYTARGEEKGRQEGIIEVAKNLLANGVSPEIIAKSSGLSVDDIRTMMN